jgi:hypothetical protein
MPCCCGPPKLPTFNLSANIWFGAVWGPGVGGMNPPPLPNLISLCQLLIPEKIFSAGVVVFTMYAAFPALTDIDYSRVIAMMNFPDIVEIPAGSRRFYSVQWLDDVGKGFPNENRRVMLNQLQPFPFPKVNPIP